MGVIVVTDDRGSPKGVRRRRAIRAVSAKPFFPPPYTPDLDPIEQAFAKLKTLPQKAPRDP